MKYLYEFIFYMNDEHLSCVHVLAIVNKLQCTQGCRFLFKTDCISFRYILRSEAVELYGRSFFFFFSYLRSLIDLSFFAVSYWSVTSFLVFLVPLRSCFGICAFE